MNNRVFILLALPNTLHSTYSVGSLLCVEIRGVPRCFVLPLLIFGHAVYIMSFSCIVCAPLGWHLYRQHMQCVLRARTKIPFSSVWNAQNVLPLVLSVVFVSSPARDMQDPM